MGRKKKEEVFQPTMSADEIHTRLTEAKVRLAEARAVSEAVRARQAQLAYDRECGELVYISSAMQEFDSQLAPIMAIIRSLPPMLSNALSLSPEQHAVVLASVDKVLKELSEIEFHFETSEEVDARASADHTSKKGKKVRGKL